MAPQRPRKATPEATQECLRLIRLGLPRRDAAALAGFSGARYTEILGEGREHIAAGRRTWQADFVVEAEKATSAFKLSASAVIINAANGAPAVFDAQRNMVRAERSPDWKAAAWMLERRFRDEYGASRSVEVTGAGGGPIEVEVATVEALVAKVHALRPVSDPLALPAGPKQGNGSASKAGGNGAA